MQLSVPPAAIVFRRSALRPISTATIALITGISLVLVAPPAVGASAERTSTGPVMLTQQAANDPIGHLDGLQQTSTGAIEATGWAADPRAPGAALRIDAYVGGPNGTQSRSGTTGETRPDVAAANSWTGARQGFRLIVPNSGLGLNSVCVYAINAAPPWTNPLIGCLQLTVWVAPPVGNLEAVTVADNTATVSGWSFDPNRPDTSIPVHVYVNGRINQSQVLTADGSRPDVNQAYGITGRHGFSATVQLTARSNNICAYGIGEWGNNAAIGWCWTVRAGGVQKPDAGSTGAPNGFAALPTYNGPLTITADGTVLNGVAVYGDLRIQAKNVTIKNSYLHCGSNTPSGNSGCVDANSSRVENLRVQNSTIRPDHPSYFRDGIVGHAFTAVGNDISASNDGIGVFSPPGGVPYANVTIEDNYIHDLTHFNYDPAHDNGTHNDAIQIQGGQNIRIAGNNVVGSVVAGDGLGVYGSHGGSALIVNQNTAPVGNLIVEDNWFDDAQNSVCITNGKFGAITMTLQDNNFGRNQYDFGNGSKYPIRIYSKSASTIYGLFSNIWDDNGVALAEGRDLGIRYNGP